MEEILKYFIEFIFLKFIYRYQKRANDVRQDLASTFQGPLVEKNYLTTSLFLNLIILNVQGMPTMRKLAGN